MCLCIANGCKSGKSVHQSVWCHSRTFYACSARYRSSMSMQICNTRTLCLSLLMWLYAQFALCVFFRSLFVCRSSLSILFCYLFFAPFSVRKQKQSMICVRERLACKRPNNLIFIVNLRCCFFYSIGRCCLVIWCEGDLRASHWLIGQQKSKKSQRLQCVCW